MSEITVATHGEGGEELEDEAAHAAAVHEGAAGVRAEQAEESADEAEQAAMVAAAAAAVVEQAAVQADAAASAAAGSAESADANARLIADALTAQTTAISSLVEELRSSRPKAKPSEPVKRSGDRAPGNNGGTRRSFRDRYYGR